MYLFRPGKAEAVQCSFTRSIDGYHVHTEFTSDRSDVDYPSSTRHIRNHGLCEVYRTEDIDAEDIFDFFLGGGENWTTGSDTCVIY